MTDADLASRRQTMVELFAKARIKQSFGMVLSYDGDSACLDLPYNPNLDHGMGSTHGGAIATLIDNAGWFTAAPYYDRWIATVEFQVRLHEPATEQPLQARGSLVRRGKRLAVAEMAVRTGAGVLVATGSGTFALTSVPYG